MQDLLNEDDFIKKTYNPWRRFMLFYVIEVAAIVVNIYLMLLSNEYYAYIAIATLVLLPAVLAPIMILSKKLYNRIIDGQAIKGMLILFSIYFLPVFLALVNDVLTTGIDSGGVIINVALIIVYGICFIAVLTTLRKKRRRAVKA